MQADMAPVHNDYLAKILTAQVYDVAIESPLELAPLLSRRLDNRLLLKREDMQAVFSFKLRGAYNKMAYLDPAVRARGVIAASARSAKAGLSGGDRHADHDSPHQDRCRTEAGGPGRPAWRCIR